MGFNWESGIGIQGFSWDSGIGIRDSPWKLGIEIRDSPWELGFRMGVKDFKLLMLSQAFKTHFFNSQFSVRNG